MSTICFIHDKIEYPGTYSNGRSITCGGVTCTCVKAPPPLCEMTLPPQPSWIESRPLRHCHRSDEYKNPKDLPLDAHCLCGDCKPRPRATTEELFANLSPMIRGGSSSSLRSITGGARLRSATGGSSSNTLERTGACTPQCSCEVSATPCGDRQESEEEPEIVPDKRTDSVIGLTIQGGLVHVPTEHVKQD
jgi:hypothetical protein